MTHALRQQQLQAYIDLFNQLPASLDSDRLEQLTSTDVEFIDPFNHSRGQPALRTLLRHFAGSVQRPHFAVVHTAWASDAEHICLLRWDFTGQLPRLQTPQGQWEFPGVSEIHFNADHKICLHRDHWDASTHFYRHLPIIGGLLGWIRRHIQKQHA